MNLAPVYPIRSARLLLRPLKDTDVDDLVEYRSIPEVCQYVPFEPQGIEDVLARINGVWRQETFAREGDSITLGAELTESGKVIGDVMVRWLSAEHSCGEIGYVFSPAFSGRGYAAEAAHAGLHVAFDDLGLHRVIARLDARNAASARLASRLGMRQEAHLRENEWFKGEWTDEIDFGMLAQEWSSRKLTGCPACD
ncbi:MAG TPA: GNAT family N-acetyltransferase [Streptosporangiaceae bacterium]|nr:GNAT family N-acetyltransferase [Streptosporangiaceae bacterium]